MGRGSTSGLRLGIGTKGSTSLTFGRDGVATTSTLRISRRGNGWEVSWCAVRNNKTP